MTCQGGGVTPVRRPLTETGGCMAEIPLGQRRIDLALMPDDQLDHWGWIQGNCLRRARHDGDQAAAERHAAEIAAVQAERDLRRSDAGLPF